MGFVRTVDLLVGDGEIPVKPLTRINRSELFGVALLQMQAKRQALALVVSNADLPIGVLSINQLTDPLLQGPLGSLRR